MQSSSDLYDIVSTYIRVIRLDNTDAAAAIEELLARYGARAGLRATLIISLLRMQIQESYSLENLTNYRDLIGDYPEALPLLERAITDYMEVWGVAYVTPQGSAHSNAWHP